MERKINEGWMKVSGEKIEDLEKYIFEQLASRPDITIMIGTDSLLKKETKRRKRVAYLTVICFKKGNNGCHVIKRRSEEIMYDFVSTAKKLNGEINRTAELAFFFREIGINPQIHLDINTSDEYGSFEVYKYIKGYFENIGFETRYKNEAVAASFAADYFL